MPNPVVGLLGSAAIGAGSQLIGSSMASKAQGQATAAQVAAQEKNIELQREIFGEQKETLKPWQDVGLDALNRIQAGIKDGSFDLSRFGYEELMADPGYQFRLQEGQNALEMGAAARGKFISGDQMNALQEYGQGLASQEFANAYGRAAGERDTKYNILAAMADRGLSAANALSGVSTGFADRLSTANTNIGNAIGQGAINQGNIWSGLASGLGQTANQGIGNYLLLQQLGG